MGKGAKIAIGCAIAAVLVVVLAHRQLSWGSGWWAKNKTETGPRWIASSSFAETQKKIDEFEAKAETNPFTPPCGRRHRRRDRLVKFLAVRKARLRRLRTAQDRDRGAVEEEGRRPSATALGAFGWINDVRLAHAQGSRRPGDEPGRVPVHGGDRLPHARRLRDRQVRRNGDGD